MCCAIVRNVPPTPTISIVKVGSNLQVTYANGILLQTTNLANPLSWTTNSATSPYTFAPSGTRMFFRARTP